MPLTYLQDSETMTPRASNITESTAALMSAPFKIESERDKEREREMRRERVRER